VAEGSDVYADFIKSLLDAESSRKASLEQRGIGVVTTSGTLVTLLFGLTAVITSAKTFALPGQAHGWLAGAAILFVVAAIAGIVTNVPLFYGQIIISETELRDAWGNSAADAQAGVTAVRLRHLDQVQKVNSCKAWILILAVLLELAAVAILTVGIVEIIHSGRGL
jgi:hypothetical protein